MKIRMKNNHDVAREIIETDHVKGFADQFFIERMNYDGAYNAYSKEDWEEVREKRVAAGTKIRKRSDHLVIVTLTKNALFYPSLGPLGDGWVDSGSMMCSNEFYPFSDWELVPEERWRNITNTCFVRGGDVLINMVLYGDQIVHAPLGARFVMETLWDCLPVDYRGGHLPETAKLRLSDMYVLQVERKEPA